ncbi:hypothetical protein BJV82DRAFT_596396 [Fennellomyces sp. T-0311]|nr:hypothetical protein BJV82DRAFT_596396 [Fennellomyces sp. T-0311]
MFCSSFLMCQVRFLFVSFCLLNRSSPIKKIHMTSFNATCAKGTAAICNMGDPHAQETKEFKAGLPLGPLLTRTHDE